MKAIVLHEYGPPKNLKLEDVADPRPGPGEVLVRVHSISLNPIDWKMRSGATKAYFPVEFPAILGRDLAGVVRELGEGVTGFKEGDRVFALANHTYAELCIVKATDLALIPQSPAGAATPAAAASPEAKPGLDAKPSLDMTTAATIPLVSLTGDQLIHLGAKVQPPADGQRPPTILLTGALGSVGRIALYCALEMGVKVIAGVRKKQIDEALALGATAAIDIDDDAQIATLGFLDAIADTIGGPLAARLIAKVKPGGAFGSVLGPPSNAALHPTVEVNAISAQPNPQTVIHYAEAVRDGKLNLPIDRILPLAEAAEAHALAEKGGVAGKIILTT